MFTEELYHRKQSVLNDAWQKSAQIVQSPSSSLTRWEVSDYLIDDLIHELNDTNSIRMRMDVMFERANPSVRLWRENEIKDTKQAKGSCEVKLNSEQCEYPDCFWNW